MLCNYFELMYRVFRHESGSNYYLNAIVFPPRIKSGPPFVNITVPQCNYIILSDFVPMFLMANKKALN